MVALLVKCAGPCAFFLKGN